MGCFGSKSIETVRNKSPVSMDNIKRQNEAAGRVRGSYNNPLDKMLVRNDERHGRHGWDIPHEDRFGRDPKGDNKVQLSPIYRDEPKLSPENDSKIKQIAQNYVGGFNSEYGRPKRFAQNQDQIFKADEPLIHQGRFHNARAIDEDAFNAFVDGENSIENISKGASLEDIIHKCRQLPPVDKIADIRDNNVTFLAKPYQCDSTDLYYDPTRFNKENLYDDRWDDYHVRMPCSPMHKDRNGRQMWPAICDGFRAFKHKCETRLSTFNDLRVIIQRYGECQSDMRQLEYLINTVYKAPERSAFLYQTLPKMCDFVLNLESIFTQPPPVLRIGSNQSVILSQYQAASLLTCAFFCLFPCRSEKSQAKSFERFPHPNFERLYQAGTAEKTEKLKCLLHYFGRVTKKMPSGLITFKRFQLPKQHSPQWNESRNYLCKIHLTTRTKIEDFTNLLQVDFANKYIGGGVLGNGCVQEEIRFTICPEMIVSLLVCEMMEFNECIFLIGCERYSTYKGYAGSFQFAGNFEDRTNRDSSGYKHCHVVAMDAIYFRERTKQYEMKSIERELVKAYTSFYPQGKEAEFYFGIATGNWGCGAFNGDRELKAIIQLMAASETKRELVYASFGDKSLVNSFYQVYDHLVQQRATVGDLYWYLHYYSKHHNRETLFNYILRIPVARIRS